MLVQFEPSEAALAIPRQAPKEMISVREEGGKVHVRTNSSSLQVIQECLRKSRYLLDERWKPETESPATVFGSAIHKAFEVFYRGDVSERRLGKLAQYEPLAFGGIESSDLIERAMIEFVKKAQPLAQLPDTDKRSIINGIWILHSYFTKFIDDPYVAYVDEKGPFVEREFTYRLHEDETLIVDIFGTIDIMFKHVANGSLIPGDHKTTSSFGFNGSSYFDREKPNSQYTGYLLGVREVFGIDTNDFIVNVLEVKAKPKTARGSPPSFPRQITTRNEDDFAEYRETVLHSVRQYLEAKKTGVWPIGPVASCASYGSCAYRQVCSAPKSLRENILKSKFIQETT